NHRVDVIFEFGDLTTRLDLNGTSQVAFGHGSSYFRDGTYLGGQVGGQQIDVTGQILPRPRRPRHIGLATEPAFHAHFASHVGNLLGKRSQRVGHVVNGFRQSRHLAPAFHGQLLPQVAVSHGGDDFNDVTHLVGEVGRHDVDVVGQFLPDACHSGDLGLTAEFAFGADLASDTRDFSGKAIQLVDHRVDG